MHGQQNIKITYSVLVCVALVIEDAERMRRIILLSAVCLAVFMFGHIIS